MALVAVSLLSLPFLSGPSVATPIPDTDPNQDPRTLPEVVVLRDWANSFRAALVKAKLERTQLKGHRVACKLKLNPSGSPEEVSVDKSSTDSAIDHIAEDIVGKAIESVRPSRPFQQALEVVVFFFPEPLNGFDDVRVKLRENDRLILLSPSIPYADPVELSRVEENPKDPKDLEPWFAKCENKIKLAFSGCEPFIQHPVSCSFTIEKDGSVSSLKVIDPTGFEKIDRGVAGLIRRAAPFELPPSDVPLKTGLVAKFQKGYSCEVKVDLKSN